MAEILPLVIEPNQLLHRVSSDVEAVDDVTREVMGSMLLSMYHYKGVGLAAVQVGILKRIIVIDVGEEHSQGIPQPMFLINASILNLSKEIKDFKEGCLSLPGIYYDVIRPEKLSVSFLDYYGKEQTLDIAHGLLSACIQHEIDHTNGIVFIDHLSKLKRDIAMKKLLRADHLN